MKTLTVLAAAALCVVALSACGSSSPSSAGSANASSNATDTARLKLQDCLRKQGVQFRGPGQGAGSGAGSSGGTTNRPSAADRAKLQKAIQGPCKQYAQGAFGNQTPAQRQEFQDAMAKFSTCMRQHGVEVPTFTPGQGPPAGGQRLNQNDPKTKAALTACQKLRPQGGRFGGGGPGGAAPAGGSTS
jgi:hypothetical protein